MTTEGAGPGLLLQPHDDRSGAGDREVSAGLGWSGATSLSRVLLLLGFGVVLARALPPSDFGLVAMVLVFSHFGVLVSEAGLNAAIVQRPTIEQRHLATAFWASAGGGLVLMLVFWLLWRMRGELTAPWSLFGLYLVLAGLERFLIEFIRTNPERVAGLTDAQLTSVALVAVGAFLVLRDLWGRGRHAAGVRP